MKAPSDPPLNGDVHKHAGNGADGRHHLDRPGDRGAADASSSSSSSGNGLSFGDAGGLYVAGGSVTLFNQDVSKDAANYGGGIFINSGAMVAASGLTMNGEQAEIGGALVNEGTLAIAKGVFKGDVAKSGVDGYTFGSGPLVGARGSTGGAIANYGKGAKLGLSGVTVASNAAKFGGGIYNHSGSISAGSLTLSGNKAITPRRRYLQQQRRPHDHRRHGLR